MLFAKTFALDEGIIGQTAAFHQAISQSVPALTSCVVKRESRLYSKPVYTFEIVSDHLNVLLWSQHTSHSYIISGNKEDLSASRDHRSNFFVGKLKAEFQSRVYVGYNQYKGTSKKQLVSIVYDHERVNATERKMEVAIPINSVNNYESFSLLQVFMNVRHEGGQNYSDTDKLIVMMQRNDLDTSLPTSLHDFNGQAVQLSTKNFQLVMSVPARMRESRVIPGHIIDLSQDSATGGGKIFLQFGKYSPDTFICQILPPISILQAFMICLSRFDTTQKY